MQLLFVRELSRSLKEQYLWRQLTSLVRLLILLLLLLLLLLLAVVRPVRR
jgi:hypothetical protein